MQQTSKQYDAVIEKCRSLYINKLKDYGCAWRILRLPSLTDQIFIKAQRIRQLQGNMTRKVEEGEISEFMGIVNYSVMALIQLENGVAEQPDFTAEQCFWNEKMLGWRPKWICEEMDIKYKPRHQFDDSNESE